MKSKARLFSTSHLVFMIVAIINILILFRTQPIPTRTGDSGDLNTTAETEACRTDPSVEGTARDKERTEEKAEKKKDDET